MPGRILRAARGEHGFGYDPLFVPDDQPERAAADHPLTSAEMDAAEKNAISHRGKAIRALVPAVEALFAAVRRTLPRPGCRVGNVETGM